MLSEDYIMRMIQLAVAALLKILGLKNAGLYDEALAMIDLALEQLLDLRASRVKNLDDERLYFLLTRQDQLDVERLALIADLFQEEGDIYALRNRLDESRADYSRALRYYLEVFFQEQDRGDESNGESVHAESGAGEVQGKIENLLKKIAPEYLESDALWPLAGYYEETGRYAAAESALLRLAALPGLAVDMNSELKAFYKRMLALPDEELSSGGLTRADVQTRLAQT